VDIGHCIAFHMGSFFHGSVIPAGLSPMFIYGMFGRQAVLYAVGFRLH